MLKNYEVFRNTKIDVPDVINNSKANKAPTPQAASQGPVDPAKPKDGNSAIAASEVSTGSRSTAETSEAAKIKLENEQKRRKIQYPDLFQNCRLNNPEKYLKYKKLNGDQFIGHKMNPSYIEGDRTKEKFINDFQNRKAVPPYYVRFIDPVNNEQ